MAIEGTRTPFSDGWWFAKLAAAHRDRHERLHGLWERFQGRPPLPELPNPKATQHQRQAWEFFQQKARTNYAELIVEAPRERMTPTNFAVADSPEWTDLARRYWSENQMPVECPDILEQMLALSVAYTIVGPPAPGSDVPVITGEDPRHVITIQDPVRPQRSLAGLKVYFDELEEREVAWLYLPGTARRAVRSARSSAAGSLQFSPTAWTFDDPIRLPIDECCVTQVLNRRGVGEFELHTAHLDRINHTLLNRIVITTMQAFRQRALKGAPEFDEQGRQIDYNERLPADPAALWLLPETVQIWESGGVDLSPILSSVKDDVRDLSAVTRVPISYFHPDAASGSAAGASLVREGLTFRAEDRTIRAGAALARTMELALRMGDAGARAGRPPRVTTEWAPVERFSLAERYDAGVKAVSAGVPWETRMRTVLGYAPEDVARMRRERLDDALVAPAPVGDVPAGAAGIRGAVPASTTTTAVELPDVATEPSAALLGNTDGPSSAGAAAVAAT